jgi:hypothetical protein
MRYAEQEHALQQAQAHAQALRRDLERWRDHARAWEVRCLLAERWLLQRGIALEFLGPEPRFGVTGTQDSAQSSETEGQTPVSSRPNEGG